MLRRGLSILGAHLLKNPAFRFHVARNQALPKTIKLTTQPMRRFASNLPPHQVLKMPALSPTMSSGKIVKWYKKVGDAIEEGDVLCDVETDKATVPFEMLDKGFIAKILLDGDKEVKVGEPVVVLVSKKEAVGAFENYSGGDGAQASAAKKGSAAKKSSEEAGEAEEKPEKAEKQPSKKKESAETGAQEKPKTPSKRQSEATEETEEKPEKSQKSEKQPSKKKEPSEAESQQKPRSSGDRVVASPLAKKTAEEADVELSGVKGSGPGGRIIKQDVDQAGKVQKEQKSAADQTEKVQPAKKKAAFVVPDNPSTEIEITSVRKTIAARLVESKTTIPHYYAQVDINMDEVIKIREELNKNEKEHGVKISINDFIMRATALASRDFPDVNVVWGTKTIKHFKYVDLAMAVATEKGLITPIIFRADTKGLLEIAKASKDLAKRARESKLQPQEFIGGTCSVSNLGMYGVNSITSIINPPHSLILGVGKTEKKIVFDENSKDETRPYKVANMMTVIASADHRVVDGALAGQWVVRIKKYLESPTNMLL